MEYLIISYTINFHTFSILYQFIINCSTMYVSNMSSQVEHMFWLQIADGALELSLYTTLIFLVLSQPLWLCISSSTFITIMVELRTNWKFWIVNKVNTIFKHLEYKYRPCSFLSLLKGRKELAKCRISIGHKIKVIIW